MEAIICKNLVKKYGNTKAIDNVSIIIEQGEIYGLIGKNGAGKTTLLRLITGLSFQTSGLIQTSKDIESKRKIGYLIDGIGAYPKLTGRQNLRLMASTLSVSNDEVEKLLWKVDLKDAADKKVREYSLGMKQRLGLAIALLGNPEIIILDEPFNGLDPVGVKDLCNLIIDINQKENKTFLISSHMLNDLNKVASKYIFINEGRVIEELENEESKIEELENYFLEKVGYVE